MYSTMGHKGIPIDGITKPVEIKITVERISSNNEKIIEFEDDDKFFLMKVTFLHL